MKKNICIIIPCLIVLFVSCNNYPSKVEEESYTYKEYLFYEGDVRESENVFHAANDSIALKIAEDWFSVKIKTYEHMIENYEDKAPEIRIYLKEPMHYELWKNGSCIKLQTYEK